jgi:Na+/H+ antiporter NhaC
MVELIQVTFILVCAWSIGKITSNMAVGKYLAEVVKAYLTPGLAPVMIFAFGALISFATGSSWGVWSIMTPIAIPMAVAFQLPIPYVVGAVISGGIVRGPLPAEQNLWRRERGLICRKYSENNKIIRE